MPAALSQDRLQHSAYLRELSERYPTPEALDDLRLKVETATAETLIEIKARFALNFARSTFDNFDIMGRVWTEFADATINRALTLAWQEAGLRHKLTLPEGNVPGLFILGLGKLGGFDLNFSSDVDLVAFYDSETLPVPEHKGQSYIASDVCKRLTQILQPRNAPEFVWRVDWRLRPESSGTGLAISTAKAETFYFFRSPPWHRLALMKARVVAGDSPTGDNFLDRMEPFIWRRNLDFTMIDELAALKTRINNEHPGLEIERAAPDPITPSATGFNLKLGRGGIREIEFIANAQQLIHGGKRPALRVTNTRAALSELAKCAYIAELDANELRENYAQFRIFENTVQMLNNDQTHIIPSGQSQTDLTELLGRPASFDENIFTRRNQVHKKFATLFEDNTDEQTSINLAGLDEGSAQIALSWTQGFQDHGVPVTSRNRYQDLGRSLVERIQRLDRPDAFNRVDDFLKQLGRSEQYFALLNQNSDLLDTLITPLLHSPHMTEILRQSPHIIDIFLSGDEADLKEQSAFVLTSPDYENRLEALRRFVNEQLFRAYTQFLEREIPTDVLQTKLTRLAEEALSLSLRIIADDLKVPEIPMTILGLGKMGTEAMAPQSDLDLVFLFADNCDPDLAAKAVRRMRTTLTTKLREGIAYELDMRLRPSGRSGPPAVKLSAFRDHHMNRAHSWEHIALAPARIVAGDKALGEKVMAIKEDILSRPRDIEAFKADAWAMFKRLSEERLQPTPPDVWRTKLRKGGLMTADYIRSCLIVSGEMPPVDFHEALESWNNLQLWERLLGLKGVEIDKTPHRYSQYLNIKSLAAQQSALENRINQTTSAFFKGFNDSSAQDPRPVLWKTSV